MTDPTPAEIEAGAAAVPRSWVNAGYRRITVDAILRAVLPDHDARVRADERARVAEEIAQAIETHRSGWHAHAAIARHHATPPTEGDHHAE